MPDVFPDPKWLELLKASRPEATALAGACFCVLMMPKWGLVQSLPDWVIILVFFLGTLTAGLVLFGFLNATYKLFPLHLWYLRRQNIKAEKKAASEYIPHMTQRERGIIGHLLHHNQKIFSADMDGGFAAPLISKSICVRAILPGQVFAPRDTPFVVPDHIWNVLAERREQFPYQPLGEDEAPPWRVPWMAW
jgi:hypothetical protein